MIPQDTTQKRSFYLTGSLINWKINKYSILAHIYFFVNAVFLPKGLLYTTILSPVFFYRTVKQNRKTYLKQFLGCLLVYDAIHLFLGVDYKSFFISNFLFILVYFFAISFYYFVNNYQPLARLFKEIVITNALLVLIAIPFFFTTGIYREWFWYINKLTVGFDGFPRLALFTYEASYYSLLLIPIWYYYCFKFLFNEISTNKWLTFLLVTIPMFMSLSFGVIGATGLTVIILCLIFSRKLFKYKRAFLTITFSVLALIFGLIALYILFPESAFFVRIENIFAGKDTSTNGRTIDSFLMAWRIADMKSIFFGAGLGQVKMMTKEVVIKYFHYWGVLPRYDIPNAMGETLAIFGFLGVALRLLLEIWLFFKTKVFANYYRLALFVFVFIYQFTGSFITNTVEYVIWVLAFSNVFQQFNVEKDYKQSPKTSV